MKHLKIFLVTFFLVNSSEKLFSQITKEEKRELTEKENQEQIEPYIDKDFVIIYSTKNYNEAHKIAISAAEKLELKLDLRDLKPSKKTGLTFSKEDCEYDYPCYIARGRWDDGKYISIEYTDYYREFQPGYYVVIAHSGEKGSQEVLQTLKKSKIIYKDAYIKTANIYIGCIH